MTYRIPFNQPSFTGNEQRYINEALRSGKISGDGLFTQRCQEILQRHLSAPKALLTCSCTHALEMAALLLDLSHGDEVIVPSFTFVSTANAFLLRGAKPVFVDIRPDTLNLDETILVDLITPRTKAVAVVHYAGVGCEMLGILETCGRHDIPVIEDNAHGLCGSIYDKPLGSFGVMSTNSFHETKNFTCGEGGALCLNDVRYMRRAEIIREKGTNRSSFFRGEVDKYTWVDIGSSYLPSEILAAFLCAQLESSDFIQAKRASIWSTYHSQLSDWAAWNGVRLPVVPEHCHQSFHMFYILMPDLDSRSRLINFLKAKGILAVSHYVPLHTSPMGQAVGGKLGQCPVCEDISDRLLRLPFYNDLAESDQAEVIESILEFAV